MQPTSTPPMAPKANETFCTAILVYQGKILVREQEGLYMLPMVPVPTMEHSPVVELTTVLKEMFELDITTAEVARRMQLGYLSVFREDPTRYWQHPVIIELTRSEVEMIKSQYETPWEFLKITKPSNVQFCLNHQRMIEDADFILETI